MVEKSFSISEQKKQDNSEKITSFQVPVSPAPQNLLEQAEAVAKRIEEGNKETRELLERQEAIRAKELLGGKSFAGQTAPEISDEEKKKQGMKEYFKGTAIGKLIK